jgi:hypothetical protein
MANRRDLIEVNPDKLGKRPGFTKVERHSALFPKRSTKPGEARALVKRALTATAAEAKPGPQPAAKPITAARVTASELAKLRAVHQSSAGSAELIGQKLTPDAALGTAYSALVTYEYTKLKAERKARLAKGEDPKRVDARWQQIVGETSKAFAAGGLRDITEADLERFSSELTKSRASFNAVVEIANSARDVVAIPGGAPNTAAGNFVTIYDRFIDLNQIVIPTPADLCDRPIEGKFTKHFSYSFNLSISIPYWCPTWTNPFRWCTKTVTIAGVSVSLGLEVGYRITCCGAIVWGQAYAQACVSILGQSICAACTARVVGLTGIARTGSGSSCSYGLGVSASISCSVGGVTVFSASVPFGWTITGPCPPAILPCNTIG